MKIKLLSLLVVLSALLFTSHAVEARSYSNFSVNFGGLFAPPVRERYVVQEYYAPAPDYYVPAGQTYCAPPPPGYVPAPREMVYVPPRAYYRQVYVQPAPAPIFAPGVGFSFSCGRCR